MSWNQEQNDTPFSVNIAKILFQVNCSTWSISVWTLNEHVHLPYPDCKVAQTSLLPFHSRKFTIVAAHVNIAEPREPATCVFTLKMCQMCIPLEFYARSLMNFSLSSLRRVLKELKRWANVYLKFHMNSINIPLQLLPFVWHETSFTVKLLL